MPARGWLPVTVPGAPAGWRDLHERFGALPFADLFADAIGYAEHGYPVSPASPPLGPRAVAGTPDWPAGVRGVAHGSSPGGRAPGPGERWRNPDAARTLRLIAATGAEDFYRGEIATALAAHAARTGGLLDRRRPGRRTSRRGWTRSGAATATTRCGSCRPTGRGSPRCWRCTSSTASTSPRCRRGTAALADRGGQARLRRRARLRGRPGAVDGAGGGAARPRVRGGARGRWSPTGPATPPPGIRSVAARSTCAPPTAAG